MKVYRIIDVRQEVYLLEYLVYFSVKTRYFPILLMFHPV